MQPIAGLSVRWKASVSILLLAVAAVAIAGLSLSTLVTYGRKVDEMQNLSSRAIRGEQVNG
ncbi:MAG: hypothetical protein JNK11_01765, partial [Alphaproteobacteria bacterium]|nr:hypothetical protein [Alphaproteobacteria bacterium]